MLKKKSRAVPLESPEEAFRGAVLAVANARRFIEDARLLKKDGSNGHAYAMVIFAEEETVKAFVLFLIHLGLLGLEAWDMLVYHTPKHAMKYLFEFIESSFLTPLEKHLKLLDSDTPLGDDDLKELMDVLGALENTVFDVPGWLSREFDVRSFVDDFRTLERKRQLNLYVDYLGDGRWSSPDSLPDFELDELLAFVVRRVETLDSCLGVISRHPEFLAEWASLLKPLLTKLLESERIPGV
ncbi:AbiV family abortive infection protein [Desulforudis sp. 1088]|uniref:AbiV family abortive infection protein n=1 Tax=unclassified Candidatus Desulforudis TaxID=2635950 RepID=UPI0034763AFD